MSKLSGEFTIVDRYGKIKKFRINKFRFTRFVLSTLLIVILSIILCTTVARNKKAVETVALPSNYSINKIALQNTLNMKEEIDKIAEEGVKEQTIYNPEIPMPKEHQEFLYKMVEEAGNLDYKKVLAIIKHESQFDPNTVSHNYRNRTYLKDGEKVTEKVISSSDCGYFQINTCNHEILANDLGTENNPLDPYINIKWGTYILSNLYDYWSEKGYTGVQLEDAVLSSYNRGITGYRKNGRADNYIKKIKEAEDYVSSAFENLNF